MPVNNYEHSPQRISPFLHVNKAPSH